MSSSGIRMKYKVSIAKSAEDDLFEIYKYIFFNDCEENANRIHSKLEEKVRSLQEFPNRGHIPKELKFLGMEDFLEINYKPLRIIYRVIDDTVNVYSILDGKRDMQKLLHERLTRE